jgi:hypothetical protein
MASQNHAFGADDAFVWGASPPDDGSVDVAVELDSEPPTVRSARPIAPALEPFCIADGSGIVSIATRAEAEDTLALLDALDSLDVPVDMNADDDTFSSAFAPVASADDEPCPETLRSPVSSGVSTNVRRARVA